VQELSTSKVGFDTEKTINVKYNNKVIGIQRLDLVVDNAIIIELKAASEINDAQIAQMISYLKAANKKVGLILNFAKNTLQIKRVVL
jgi:GxxExxY protein